MNGYRVARLIQESSRYEVTWKLVLVLASAEQKPLRSTCPGRCMPPGGGCVIGSVGFLTELGTGVSCASLRWKGLGGVVPDAYDYDYAEIKARPADLVRQAPEEVDQFAEACSVEFPWMTIPLDRDASPANAEKPANGAPNAAYAETRPARGAHP